MKTTTFISLGKGKARKESAKSKGETEMIYYFDQHLEIQSIPLIYDTADMMLTKVRDEAHRFANKYRTTRMSKEWK
jgi:excinuclease UvrABC nuclease subunit